jgi:hypothetical protein
MEIYLKELTDQQLMDLAHKWLDTPNMQRRPNSYVVSFIADVCRHWRKENFISIKQRVIMEALLTKHTN